jgi:hypothetical protein
MAQGRKSGASAFLALVRECLPAPIYPVLACVYEFASREE